MKLLGKFIYDTFRDSFGSRFFNCDDDKFGYGTKIIVKIPEKTSILFTQTIQKTSNFIIDVYNNKDNNDHKKDKDNIGNGIIQHIFIDYFKRICNDLFVDLNINGKKIGSENAFGGHILDITKEKVTKIDGVDTAKEGFSCWSSKSNVFIRYYWPDDINYNTGKINVYYGGILVDDEDLKKIAHIPFWNVDVHLFFEESTSAFLEVNRDSFKKSAIEGIAHRIRMTHLCCLKMMVNLQTWNGNNEDFYSIWKLPKKETYYNEIDTINEYRANILAYIIYIVRCLNETEKDYVDVNTLLDNSTIRPVTSKSLHYYTKMNTMVVYKDSKTPGKKDYMVELMTKNDDQLWFVDESELYTDILVVDEPALESKEEMQSSPSWSFIMHDYFGRYIELAIIRAKMLRVLPNRIGKVIIYQIGKRTGEPVEMDDFSYWSIVLTQINYYKKDRSKNNLSIKKKTEKDNIDEEIRNSTRLVFPANGKYDAIEVYSLPYGTNRMKIRKFNSWVIAPLCLNQLLDVLESKYSNKKELEKYIEENKWSVKTKKIFEHIENYSSNKIENKEYKISTEDRIKRQYVDWLYELYQKYISKEFTDYI